MPTLDHIVQLLIVHRYVLLFPIAVIEGPIISIIAGFLASKGLMSLVPAYFILLAGDVGGDVIYYLIGRWGGIRFINRWGSKIGLTPARIAKVDRHFIDHGGKTLLFGKWTQTVGAPILVTAGMLRMKFSKYLWYNTLGTLPKAAFLLAIGYYFGVNYNKLAGYLDTFSWIALGIVILGFVIYYVFKKKQ